MQGTNTDTAKEVILTHCAIWEALGITEVTCLYSGSGDEGSISDFEIEPSTITDKQAGIGFSGPIYNAFEALTFAEVGWDNEVSWLTLKPKRLPVLSGTTKCKK